MTLRYFTDHMLGRLTRWMRLLGLDTEYASADLDDSTIAKRCEETGRILLTRDKELHRRSRNSVLIESTYHIDQVRQIIHTIKLDEELFFTRCPECNAVLEDMPSISARGSIPEGVIDRHQTVMKCPACGKIYWKGDHYRKIQKTIKDLMDEK